MAPNMVDEEEEEEKEEVLCSGGGYYSDVWWRWWLGCVVVGVQSPILGIYEHVHICVFCIPQAI